MNMANLRDALLGGAGNGEMEVTVKKKKRAKKQEAVVEVGHESD
jgi:hypothetical protein